LVGSIGLSSPCPLFADRYRSVGLRAIAIPLPLLLTPRQLLRLQLVHLAQEILEQLPALRTNALLQLLNDLVRRHAST